MSCKHGKLYLNKSAQMKENKAKTKKKSVAFYPAGNHIVGSHSDYLVNQTGFPCILKRPLGIVTIQSLSFATLQICSNPQILSEQLKRSWKKPFSMCVISNK